jgi:Arc/MetJ-type ribon-helix-helix transcriptional regulator
MKLSQLRQLIKEELEAVIQEESYTPVDEVGKFFVVKRPKGKMTKEDMVYEATVFDEIKMDETRGVYTNKSEANRHATEALKEYEMQLKEMEAAMDEFREAKKGIDEKKKAAREKIEKLK